MADARGARLLADLDNAFKRDPHIDEYDILPVLEPKHNKSPFVLQDHKLGVEAWAVKILLRYSLQRLKGCRSRQAGQHFTDRLELCGRLSRTVLLFSPEVYTAWNIRKELVEHGHLSLVEDLTFGALVLSKHPNSPETFVHRRWLFQQLLNNCLSSSCASNSSCTATDDVVSDPASLVNVNMVDVTVSASVAPGDVCENGTSVLESSRLLRCLTHTELIVCNQAAEKYASNYHAWSHRVWVIQHCLKSSLEVTKTAHRAEVVALHAVRFVDQILLSELKATESWTSQHVSDHSGFHYRQFLLSELLNKQTQPAATCFTSSAQLLHVDMALVCDLLHSFPGHETLWYHRRFLFQAMLKSGCLDTMLHKHSSNGHVPLVTEHVQSPGQESLKSFYICQEIDSVLQKTQCQPGSYQQVLMQKYLHWLRTL